VLASSALLLASISLVLLGFALVARERATRREKEQAAFERRKQKDRQERQEWAKRQR
jgi:hypothetical protein